MTTFLELYYSRRRGGREAKHCFCCVDLSEVQSKISHDTIKYQFDFDMRWARARHFYVHSIESKLSI